MTVMLITFRIFVNNNLLYYELSLKTSIEKSAATIGEENDTSLYWRRSKEARFSSLSNPQIVLVYALLKI